jgi:hypothetical protein
MLRGADAEADAQGQVGVATQARHGLLDVIQGRRAGAGDTGHRHVVDEAGAAGQHGGQAVVVGGRRGQADEVDACALRRLAQLVVVLRRQVDHDQAVDAGSLGVGDEALDAVDEDRVVVAHQHQRRALVAGAEFAHHLQGLGQRLLGPQRADIGELDGRTVGHRVGEGHAQLDHVGAGVRQALENLQGSLVVGVTGGDEGDQRGAVFLLEFGETVVQAAHACFSWLSCMWCITVCMSLSPRPDRLITIR